MLCSTKLLAWAHTVVFVMAKVNVQGVKEKRDHVSHLKVASQKALRPLGGVGGGLKKEGEEQICFDTLYRKKNKLKGMVISFSCGCVCEEH